MHAQGYRRRQDKKSQRLFEFYLLLFQTLTHRRAFGKHVRSPRQPKRPEIAVSRRQRCRPVFPSITRICCYRQPCPAPVATAPEMLPGCTIERSPIGASRFTSFDIASCAADSFGGSVVDGPVNK